MLELSKLIGLFAVVGIGMMLWGAFQSLIDWNKHRRAAKRHMRDLRQVRCPFCKDLIDRHAVMCIHCYRDLKTNCPGCGEIVSLKARRCPLCRTLSHINAFRYPYFPAAAARFNQFRRNGE